MYNNQDWLDDAVGEISKIDGVDRVVHDSGPDYQVYVTDDASKNQVMDAVESIYDSRYMITVSPTDRPD